MSKPPQFVVEQCALGERDPVAEFDHDVTALKESNAEILARYPSAGVVVEVNRRRAQHRRRSNRWRITSFAFASAASCAVAALLMIGDHESVSDGTVGADVDDVRIKGPTDPRLRIYRIGDGVAEISSGDRAAAGERLQLVLSGGSRAFGVVVSLDGWGNVTLHYPSTKTRSTALPEGKTQLDHSFQLDNAPDFERFFFLTSSGPIDVDGVMRGIEALGRQPRAKDAAPALGNDIETFSFLVAKDS